MSPFTVPKKLPPSLPFSSLVDLLSDDQSTAWQAYSWSGPTASEIAKWQTEGFSVYQGKIRTILSKDGRIHMIHSDRLTAFDRLISHVPGKGILLAAISRWWFEQLSKELPTHFISSPSPRVLITEACIPFKVEVVVRGYLAGSMLRAYKNGERVFCGVKLPDGLKDFQRLPEPIITPTSKAEAFEHDVNVTAEELVTGGIVSTDEWSTISTLALKAYSLGTRLYQEKGWILVDTKYEFGKSPSTGMIKLIDEVHTPDSSRLWILETYNDRLSDGLSPEMLDKEIVRKYLLEQGFSGQGDVPQVSHSKLLELLKVYLHVAETLTGPVTCEKN